MKKYALIRAEGVHTPRLCGEKRVCAPECNFSGRTTYPDRSAAGLLLAVCCIAAVLVSGGCSKKAGASVSGAPVEITVEVFDRGTDGGKTDVANNNWTKWIQEKILKDENIKVQFVGVPRWTEGEALINLVAAGTPPDVCLTYSGPNITNWAAQGGVFDLSPYVDTTLKDLKAFLGSDAALPGRDLIWRGKDNASGKLYSIPSRRMNVAQRNTFIRKDWLDALGLPLPETTQEFYDALVAFKEKDPGNVGKNRVIPFTLNAEVRWSASTVIDAFIDPSISDKDRWINTVAERSFMVPGYKEGLRFLNKMYNDGLVDRDFPLYSNEDTYKNLIKSGVVGAFTGEWDRIFRESDALFTDLLKNVPTGNWVPVDCMTSSDGITHKGAYDAAGVLYFIPASAKNPDAAMRYLNWLAKYENYHYLQVGTEGVVHTLENGVPKVNPMAGGGWIQNSPLNIDYTIPINGLNLGSEEQNIKAIAAGYPWPPELITSAYTIAMTNARPAIVVSPSSPLTVAGPLEQTLISKGTVIYTESITAPAANFDRVYDAGIADWLRSGAQAIIDERAAKYVAP